MKYPSILHFCRTDFAMKIAVLGATGPSGIQVVEEALERGHVVTAIVRNPEKMQQCVNNENLKVLFIVQFSSPTRRGSTYIAIFLVSVRPSVRQ